MLALLAEHVTWPTAAAVGGIAASCGAGWEGSIVFSIVKTMWAILGEEGTELLSAKI